MGLFYSYLKNDLQHSKWIRVKREEEEKEKRYSEENKAKNGRERIKEKARRKENKNIYKFKCCNKYY